MREFALLGHPLKYSLSPVLHQAAYIASGMSAAYFLLPTAPEDLPARVQSLRDSADFGGCNVTVPHKAAIIPLLDGIAPSAAAVNAVNTVVVEGRRLIGHNTDLSGFRASLREDCVPVTGQTALVIGAGGAARSVCHVLLGSGVERLYLVNRTAERAEQLLRELQGTEAGRASQWLAPTSSGRKGGASGVSALPPQVVDPRELRALAGQLGLVVNCTSSQDPWPALGLQAEEFWSRGQGHAVDLAYGRMLAGFLAVAERCGWRTSSGEGMLLWQAAHAFELWTDLPAPVAAMRAALQQELARQV